MSAKFGPAGNSESFSAMGYKSSLQVPQYIEQMGLDVFEYQCGRGVNIGAEKAAQLGALATQAEAKAASPVIEGLCLHLVGLEEQYPDFIHVERGAL